MRERTANITIHDVAAAAGVSIKTVSRVMREEPRVSADTRKAVREAIERLHYVPHPSASALASSVTNVIGLVGLRRNDVTMARSGFEYNMGLQSGALNACEALGFGLRVVRLEEHNELSVQELITRVRSREIGGYLIPAPTCDIPGLADRLAKAGIRYATLSPQQAHPEVPTVSADDRAAMRALVQKVLAQGHRRIGFIRGYAGWRDTEERYAGYLDALAGAGIEFDPALVQQGAFTFDSGLECAGHLLALTARPTAIVASSDGAAAGVLACAHGLGLHLPQDLSVTGYDDFDMARKLWPSLTTIHQPIEKMAEIATRQVIALLQPQRNGMVAPPKQVLMHSELVLRDSLAPAPPATPPLANSPAPKPRARRPRA